MKTFIAALFLLALTGCATLPNNACYFAIGMTPARAANSWCDSAFPPPQKLPANKPAEER